MISDYQFQNKTTFLTCFIIIISPFLFFYWMVPFISDVTIGGDYLRFPIRNQMELLFSCKTGSFPLYVPGFASGHSSAALTLGQFFHPLSHIASVMPGYWDGKAIEWNTLLKLLSLGLTQLALFAFLRSLKISTLFSFLLSVIAVYNLRLIDLFRYGASLEAYTGHLLLCSAIGWYYINPTKLRGPLCITGATYLLICSGHPQMMYYGLLGAGLFLLVAPFYLSTVLPGKEVNFNIALRFWLKVGGCLSLGVMLSSVYILPFYFDFLSDNVDRVGQTYSWANKNLDTFIGSINNFFLPLRSGVNGAFGGSTLIIIPAVLPLMRIFKIKIPRNIWIVWGLLLLMFLYTQGSRTPIHKLVWQYVPFASSMRVPGRISMIMPFFSMILFAWIIKVDSFSARPKALNASLKPSVIIAGISLFLIIIFYISYISGYHLFEASFFLKLFELNYPSSFHFLSFFEVELLFIISGVASLLAFTFHRLRDASTKLSGSILIVATILQLGIVMKYGAVHWLEKKHDSPTYMDMQMQKRDKLAYRYNPGVGLSSSIVRKQLRQSFIEPYLGKIFTQVTPVNSQDEAYIKMEQSRLPQQVFIEGYDLGKAREITEGAKHMEKGMVKFKYSSFNRLQFHVDSESPAIFGLSYPYTGNWRAWVNGASAHVYRVNGAAHAVEIPEGKSLVEFRYWSNACFWGLVISCIAFAATGFFICKRILNGVTRIAGVILVCMTVAGGFMLWYNTLYAGDNLETQYTWTYTPPLKSPDLAYGKRNWLGSSATSLPHMYQQLEHEFYVSRFVDGDRSPESGFSTTLSHNPAWFVDLNRVERIRKILLYESGQNPAVPFGPLDIIYYDQNLARSSHRPLFYTRPLKIAVSNNGSMWSTVASVDSPVKDDGHLTISFDNPQIARYIKIVALGMTKLSFDEVEVYGPSDNE